MVYRGHLKEGVVVLDDAADLPDGTRVTIRVETDDAAESPPSLYERLKSVVGKAEGLPEDAASQIDHYLYGLPKR